MPGQKRAESIDSDATDTPSDKGGAIPTSALQLHLEEIDIRGAIHINNVLHSVLPTVQGLDWATKKVAYVATFDGVAYATAIWTTPIAANRLHDGFYALELRRFAISSYAPKNTASRLLAVMVKMIRKKWPEVRRFISYQAVDHHNGTIYKAAGWVATATSEASVWHVGEKRAPLQTDSVKVRWEKIFPAPPGLPLPVKRFLG